MADNSKKVSELPTAANVALSDRVLVLRDPASNPSVRTVNVSIFVANVSSVVANTILTSNIVPLVVANVTPLVIANITPTVISNVSSVVIANVTPAITSNVIGQIANNLFISNVVPSNTSSNGVQGVISYDSNYFYVCIANNSWKRAALSTW